MKVYNNEITVYRGETFTIDKTVVNKDDSPYIVSKKLTSPFVLISVSSSLYKQTNRYVKNWWLDASRMHRFYNTRAIKAVTINEGVITPWTTFDGQTTLPTDYAVDDAVDVAVDYQFTTTENTYYYFTETVFYVEDANGNKEYRYFKFDSYDPDASVHIYTGTYVPYKFRIVKTFLQDDTTKWVEQSYLYGIRFIAGQRMLDYLRGLCDIRSITYLPTDSTTTLYEMLVAAGQSFSADFSPNAVMGHYDVDTPILIPTKLSVLSAIYGGI